MLGFYDILPLLPKGRGTAEWRWRDTFGFLQTEVSPSHGFAATAADGGRPLCHSVTSPHTVGSHPLGKGAKNVPTLAI